MNLSIAKILARQPRRDDLQLISRSADSHMQKPLFLARADGMYPSTAFKTVTFFHSRPLAECIVEIVTQSSELDESSGGSRTAAVRNALREE